MNILYIDHYAGSPEMGMEFRPYYLGREWSKMGHNVTIIAGDYSHLRKNNPIVTMDFQKESIDDIDYLWVKTGTYSGNSAQRAVSMFRFVMKLRIHAGRIVKDYSPDLVISSSTYPLDTFAGQLISKKAKAKYVHEVHDMWPSTLYEVGGMSKKHPFVVLMQIAENSAYKHCDKCVSLLPYAKEYMAEHGLMPDKFVNIQNGIVKDEWINSSPIPDRHESFFYYHSEDFVVGYFGGHALSNALNQLLDVAKEYRNRFPDDRVIFVLVGDGVEKQHLINQSIKDGIDNIFFMPPVEKRAIPNLLSHFDCSYMTGLSSPLYRFGLSLNKMYDSMMAGLPVICAFDAPSTLVEKYHFGLQCKPEEINAIIDYIHHLLILSKNERIEIGKKGKDAVLLDYNYETLAEQFLSSI